MEDDESGFYVNEVDGLSNDHPALPDYDDVNRTDELNPDSFDDLPTSLIVTNIHSSVFVSEDAKAEMESLFQQFSEDVTFQWLKSFRRLRVNYIDAVSAGERKMKRNKKERKKKTIFSRPRERAINTKTSSLSAYQLSISMLFPFRLMKFYLLSLHTANARIQLHEFKINDSIINCYFAQPVTPVSRKNLQPPAPTKQFLISPPSSPPAGWMQNEELEPLVNQDLIAALANLTPGEVHELHAAAGESQPSIVVHTAIVQDAQAATVVAEEENAKIIPHTKCPERA